MQRKWVFTLTVTGTTAHSCNSRAFWIVAISVCLARANLILICTNPTTWCRWPAARSPQIATINVLFRPHFTSLRCFLKWAGSGFMFKMIICTQTRISISFLCGVFSIPHIPVLGTFHKDRFQVKIPCASSAMEIRDTFHERSIDPQRTPAALLVSHSAYAWGQTALEETAYLTYQTMQLDPGIQPLQ